MESDKSKQSDWDNYFISLAYSVAAKSKDPTTKVGAIIADSQNRFISSGYNGFPRKILDKQERLIDREQKLLYTVHGEINAILFARGPVEGYTLYTVPFAPCAACTKLVIQAGIIRVVAPKASEQLLSRWSKELELSASMFKEAGVELILL